MQPELFFIMPNVHVVLKPGNARGQVRTTGQAAGHPAKKPQVNVRGGEEEGCDVSTGIAASFIFPAKRHACDHYLLFWLHSGSVCG